MGRGLEKKGSSGRELKWESGGYRGSRGSVEGRKEMAPEVGPKHKLAALLPGTKEMEDRKERPQKPFCLSSIAGLS